MNTLDIPHKTKIAQHNQPTVSSITPSISYHSKCPPPVLSLTYDTKAPLNLQVLFGIRTLSKPPQLYQCLKTQIIWDKKAGLKRRLS